MHFECIKRGEWLLITWSRRKRLSLVALHNEPDGISVQWEEKQTSRDCPWTRRDRCLAGFFASGPVGTCRGSRRQDRESRGSECEKRGRVLLSKTCPMKSEINNGDTPSRKWTHYLPEEKRKNVECLEGGQLRISQTYVFNGCVKKKQWSKIIFKIVQRWKWITKKFSIRIFCFLDRIIITANFERL